MMGHPLTASRCDRGLRVSRRAERSTPERQSVSVGASSARCAASTSRSGVILLAIPPMVDDVRAELGISRGMLGFALGAWSLLYIVTAPPAGQLIDRLGLRRSLTVGSLLVAVSAVMQAAAQGVVMLWLAIGIIGIGGPLVSLSAPKLVAVWFANPRERALAVGVYTSAPALGGVFALLLTNSVLLPVFGDWRSVLMFEATLNLVAALAWVLVSGRAPSEPVAQRSARRLRRVAASKPAKVAARAAPVFGSR